jgi:hypothetical protein
MSFRVNGSAVDDVGFDSTLATSFTKLLLPHYAALVSGPDSTGNTFSTIIEFVYDPDLAPDVLLGGDWESAVTAHSSFSESALPFSVCF